MKKQQIYRWFFLAFLLVMLYSCNDEKNIRYFNLNIELNEPITGLKENDPLPAYFKVLVNYIDTSSSKDLLVPIVTFKRNDLKQPNLFKLKAPLSWINNFRNSREMLPSEYLREDYDKLISGMITPKILVSSKGTIKGAETMTEDKKNVFTLNIKASGLDSIAILKEKIAKRLCETKGSLKIIIKIIDRITKIEPEKSDTVINFKDKPKIPENDNQKPDEKTAKSHQNKTVKFPNGDIYIGEVLSGTEIPDGNGKMTFKNQCQISLSDMRKREANSGDYLVGVWSNGEPQICDLFDSSTNYRLTYMP